MSLFGSAILERLHTNSPATNPDNPFYKVFDNTVGEWLDHCDVDKFHEELFINSADGKWLDLHGKEYNVPRKIGETDDIYRERIIKHTLGELTPKLLTADFGVDLYIDAPDFDINNTLTSDNYYISGNGYIAFTDNETKELVEKNLVLNEVIRWFVV